MAKKRPKGICSICGFEGSLSYEHVPPRAAFNDSPVIEIEFYKALDLDFDEKPRGRINQKGAGGYTLCEKCNNITGKWYARRFTDWCYQGMNILRMARGNPTLMYMQYTFPFSIIKQIITMFFSVNGPGFASSHPDLVQFILDRDRKYLSPKYGVYVYYNTTGYIKRTPIGVGFDVRRNVRTVMSELTFPPFGYLLTFNSPPPDRRLFDISHFAKYGYEEFSVQELRLPALPIHTMFPGDYRTKEEVRETIRQNELLDQTGD